jgi:hypothetical protein
MGIPIENITDTWQFSSVATISTDNPFTDLLVYITALGSHITITVLLDIHAVILKKFYKDSLLEYAL